MRTYPGRAAVAVLVVLCAGTVFPAAIASADRGHLVIQTLKPNVSVSNVGQKAIIGWNGEEEVLILATDLSAGADAKVLEFMPLPSKPTEVAKAGRQAFSAVERIIAEHAPLAPRHLLRHRTAGPGPAEPAPVEIVFHEQIGAHDIIIAKTDDFQAFLSWVRDFVAKHRGTFQAADERRLEPVLRHYLDGGYNYFVFDVIELTEDEKTVDPICYRFPTDHLFFPLVVSAMDVGETEMSLFLLTPHRVDIWGTKTGFSAGFYREEGRVYTNEDPGQPIKFSLKPHDVLRISSSLADLFEDWDSVPFTAARYKGPVSKLERDLVLRSTEERLRSVRVEPLGWGREWRLDNTRRSLVGYISDLAWSPNGDRLCVQGGGLGSWGPHRGNLLLTVAPEGGAVNVVSLNGWISRQCWSPDGRTLCYLDGSGYERNVWLVHPESGATRVLTHFSDSEVDPPFWRPPAWSPSGEWISFIAFGNIWLIRPDGSGLRRVTELPERMTDPKAKKSAAAAEPPIWYCLWSGNGKRLLYALREENAVSTRSAWTLRLYHTHENRSEVLLNGQKFAGSPYDLCWQPGGSRIAFCGKRPGDRLDSVWITSPDGTEANVVDDVWSGSPLWAPDGRRLIVRGFHRGERGYGAWVVDVDSGKMEPLGGAHFLSDTRAQVVAFQPGGQELAFARSDRLFFACLDGSEWREMALCDSSEVRPRQQPAARWREHPAIQEAARQWHALMGRKGVERGQMSNELLFGTFHDLYRTLTDDHKRAMQEGHVLSLRDLTAPQQTMLLTGLAYRALDDAPDNYKPEFDPLTIPVPGWSWSLDDLRVRFTTRPDGELRLDCLGGPWDGTSFGLGWIEDDGYRLSRPE